MSLPRFAGLWRHDDFVRLWFGQTVSVFGSLVGTTAISFTAILVLQASPFQLGLLSAARLVPGLLAGLAAGTWVDRMRRRPLLIGADIGRGVLLATIPVAAVLGVLRIEQLYVVTLLVSVLTILFDVAYQSYLPSRVDRSDLLEGNSKLTASAAVAEVSAFGVGGWLVQLVTAPMAILVDAFSFIVSAIALGRIRTPEPALTNDLQQGMRREIVEGLRAVMDHPVLRATTLCKLSQELFTGMYGTLVVLYVARDLGFSPGALGTIWAVGGLSALLGAAATERVTRRVGIGPAMTVGLLASGVSLFFIPLAQGVGLVAVLLLLLQQLGGDGAATVYEINNVTLRQSVAPERLLGRVNASAQFVGLGGTLVGSLLGGLLGELIGVRATLFLGAAGAMFSVVWLYRSPVWGLQTVDGRR